MTETLRRVAQALALGATPLPATGRVAVFDPPAVPVLPDLPAARIEVISHSAATHAACARAGVAARLDPEGAYAAALVFLDRVRPFARQRIAQAARMVRPGGPVLVDGQKTDGIEPALKDCRERAEISDSFVKSHGRLFWFAAAAQFPDWETATQDWPLVEGFRTGAGVFSSDGIDPGSALLAASLPPTLGGAGADLGAGWGYLAARALAAAPGIQRLHLVEDDHRALASAGANIADPRAVLHWADATVWTAPEPLDFVIANPPFHGGRAADPDLGRAFIAAAAAMLGRSGRLWLVANRHLPYEAALDQAFHTVEERVAQAGYKVIEATGPRAAAGARRRS